jgi:hypothetical protein
MTVRDLTCWPPTWRGVSGGSGHVAKGEAGILIAVHWDWTRQSLTLTMEDAGDRHTAVLDDEVGRLTRLYLLLGWHIGRPLANIGRLEVTPPGRPDPSSALSHLTRHDAIEVLRSAWHDRRVVSPT